MRCPLLSRAESKFSVLSLLGPMTTKARWRLIVPVVLSGLLPTVAGASQTVKLHAAFSPNHLGKSTTILVHFEISSMGALVPSPVTDIDLSLPPGMGLGTTELGTTICDPVALLQRGPAVCSSNSYLGFGSAIAEVPFGPAVVSEPVSIDMFMGPAVNHHTAMLFYIDAKTPVAAQLVFPALLLQDAGSFESAHLNTIVPLTPSLPGASDVSVVDIRTSFGPLGLTYYRRVKGRKVGYRPIGMAVPARCPAGGFKFVAAFHFQDGSAATASARVACPRSVGHR
jgi:hypothetical protein